jgi:hypothetical protein
MTTPTWLERELTDWLSETAMPQMPDYADDILAETSRIDQRPRWSFVGRWLPTRVGIVAPIAGRVAIKGLGVLVLLGVLIAALAFVVGSRRSTLVPFGLAANGLLAFDQAGSIYVSDPDTPVSTRIVSGSDAANHHPRWSLDGTRIAFLREVPFGQAVVVADATGRVLSASEPVAEVDSDSIMWSPDGRQIAIAGNAANGAGGRAIYLVDAVDGALRQLDLPYDTLEMYWRPPDGRELLFHTGGLNSGLSVVSLEDGAVRSVTRVEGETAMFRPLGWTPDGRSILYENLVLKRSRTVVLDVQTGEEIELDVMFGHVSNDGTRVAGLDSSGRPCIVAISGGTCAVIPDTPGWTGFTSAAIVWSPDDRWIAMIGPDESSILIVDPTGALPPRQVASKGPGSWQRIAP